MLIAIASGKGGTGKTTVAVSLAALAAENRRDVTYADCDVEAPNGHLFCRPEIHAGGPIDLAVAEYDPQRCTHCGRCGEICQFGAILNLPEKVMVFPELCHGCGGCWLVCPTRAMREGSRSIGTAEIGRAGDIRFVHGRLEIGQPLSPPAISAVKRLAGSRGLVFLDSPPGTSCPAVETLRESDFVLLVTEPTPFGLHDLKLAVDTVRRLGKPFAVFINRSGAGDSRTEEYCAAEAIDVIGRLPDDRAIAEAYSRGEIVARSIPQCREVLQRLLDDLLARAGAFTPSAGREASP